MLCRRPVLPRLSLRSLGANRTGRTGKSWGALGALGARAGPGNQYHKRCQEDQPHTSGGKEVIHGTPFYRIVDADNHDGVGRVEADHCLARLSSGVQRENRTAVARVL